MFKQIAIGSAVVVALIAGLHACSVATTVTTAPGRVISKTLETDNIVRNYEWFYDVQARYESRAAQVKEYSEFLTSETDAKEKARLRIELSAVRQSCRDLVTSYNANSEKVNTSIFKSNNLPVTLDSYSCEVK